MSLKKNIVPLFFLSVLLIGCLILPDFGMSWDEHPQREHGLVTVDYLNRVFDWGREEERYWLKLETYKSRHYGVLFQLVAYYAEDWAGAETNAERYRLRHYLGFIFFWFASIFLYKLLKLRFGSRSIALAGTVMLFLTPRICGHAFFNPKDTVLLSGMLIGTYTLIRFINKKNLKYALLHALLCAVVINIRIVGIILPAFTLLFLFFEIVQRLLHRSDRFTWLRLLWIVPVWGLFTVLLTIAGWPYLWAAPLGNLLEAFEVMSAYPWDGKILLYGDYLHSLHLPWYYIPAWIAATLPTLYTIGGVGGMVLILRHTFLNLLRKQVLYADVREMIDVCAFGLFFGTIFMVVLQNSVLYNGWRQVYFIYPAFLIMAVGAFVTVIKYVRHLKNKKRKQIFVGILVVVFNLQIGAILLFMYQYHPWWHLYFGLAAGKNKTERFEMDYWGVAHKEAIEKIAEFDKSGEIKVSCATGSFPGQLNWEMLSPEIKQRVKYVKKLHEADYVIVGYIGKYNADRRRALEYPFNQITVFTFSVEGDEFLRVIKTRAEDENTR